MLADWPQAHLREMVQGPLELLSAPLDSESLRCQAYEGWPFSLWGVEDAFGVRKGGLWRLRRLAPPLKTANLASEPSRRFEGNGGIMILGLKSSRIEKSGRGIYSD